MSEPVSVIVTRRLPDAVETRMRELFGARLNIADAPMEQAALKQAASEADILAPTITDRIDADVIASAAGRLKLIANFGAGVDHIDLQAAHEAGIVVTNTPGVLTEDTADMTMAACGDWPPLRPIGTVDRFANCQECHGSQILTELDPGTGYTTSYTTLQVNCESCHGPARRHVEPARDARRLHQLVQRTLRDHPNGSVPGPGLRQARAARDARARLPRQQRAARVRA